MRLAAFSSALVLGLGLAAAASAAPAAGDAARGKTLFDQRCMVCHNADKGGPNGVGPALWGVYGDKAANVPGFNFSDKLKASNLTWTPETLDKWLANPQALVPGTKMAIAPNNPGDRADLIAFLKTRADAPAAPKKVERHERHERRERGGRR
jgi:cytochrome c2